MQRKLEDNRRAKQQRKRKQLIVFAVVHAIQLIAQNSTEPTFIQSCSARSKKKKTQMQIAQQSL